jgi:hypothetical protein
VDIPLLLKELDPTELTSESPVLMVLGIGTISDMEEVAKFMYRGGPLIVGGPLVPNNNDYRPDPSYWYFVKKEMQILLCTNDKRYRKLWGQINSLRKKSTTIIVGLIATFLGESIGAPATLLSGFIALCFYAAIKVGKEAFCNYIAQENKT